MTALKEEHPGFFPLLSSMENLPIEQILKPWASNVRNGHIKRVTDGDLELPVFEICGNNIAQNWLAFPAKGSMRVKLPVLVLLVKNLDKYFRFEVTILDDSNVVRTFIASNNQSITRIKPFQCSMPLELDAGWNEVIFDLNDYCTKAFGTVFMECQRVQINANCRVVRIYFNDRVKAEEEIPLDYKLFMRVQPFKG